MIVGVDIGTQSLKVLVTDENLKVLGSASKSYPVDYPQPGWAEQHPRLWEEALGPAIALALQSADLPPQRIKAIGLTGQLDGCQAVDAQGAPLGPCLIWMDRRAQAETGSLPPDEVRRLTGVGVDASHMAAKINWLKKHLPGVEKATRFHQPVSYLTSRLTGEHVFDHGMASSTMLYSLSSQGYDARLLESFNIRAEELPAIAEASARAGRMHASGAALTGLPPGIPVAVGTGDDYSNPLGAGVITPGRVVCTLGTAEVVGAIDTHCKIDEMGLLETHRSFNGSYFIENPGWLSGGALAWFVETFRLKDFKELDALANEIPAGADGLIFLPALSGAMAPEWIASARGCFYGLTPAHGVGAMARAVLEGCAFAMRDVVERLRAMDVPVEAVRLLGGGARSSLWGQIRADLCGLPVEVPRLTDTSPMGAAMLAAVAGDIQPSLTICAGLVGESGATIMPHPQNRSRYDAAYAAYGKLFESLRPMF